MMDVLSLLKQLKEKSGAARRPRSEFLKIVPPRSTIIELGVARGEHSAQILSRTDPEFLYSVDMYAGDRNHDVAQYRLALAHLDRFRSKNSLLRMRFDEALPLFEDHYFDVVYVDGYAHTGEEEGKTFTDWWPKLKPGGLFCGDDYHSQWPKVVEEVDRFAAREGLELIIFPTTDHFQTWFAYKPHPNEEFMSFRLREAIAALK